MSNPCLTEETPTKKGRSKAFKVLLAAVAMAAASLSTSNWCFVGLAAAVAAPILDAMVDRQNTTGRKGKAALCSVRLLLAVAVGVAIGWLLRVTPGWAFREAMEIDPPAGVHVTRVQRHYEGGPGEHTLIIEFTADESALKTLISDQVMEQSEHSRRIEDWFSAGRTWEAAFDCFCRPTTFPFSRRSWMRIRPLDNPQVYDFGIVNGGHLALLYDASSKRAVMVHARL